MTDKSDDTQGEVMRLTLRVPLECDGWRLDHFLKHRIRRLSRTKIQKVIKTQVRLAGGQPPRSSLNVRAGWTLWIDRPAPIEPEVPRHFEVLAEDADYLAIDKPAGLPMHTTAKFWKNTLVALLRERYPKDHFQICHRIDRETSGVLLIAKNASAASFLKQAFARRNVKKTYWALVHGCPAELEGVIDRPLRLLDSKTHIMMGVDPDGLPAVTNYRVLAMYANHAFVEARPLTGRQHQIRVHLASLGHPIVGDKLYRASEADFMNYCDLGMTEALLTRFDGLSRHALHAAELAFPHPHSGETIAIKSPLPLDLKNYIAELGNPLWEINATGTNTRWA